jgi:hypothetical protein
VENVSGYELGIAENRKNIRIELYTGASSTGLPPQTETTNAQSYNERSEVMKAAFTYFPM